MGFEPTFPAHAHAGVFSPSRQAFRLDHPGKCFGGSGANRTRGPGIPSSWVQARSASHLPSLPWRRGQESNLQGRFRNLTVFETAGPVNVPTPPGGSPGICTPTDAAYETAALLVMLGSRYNVSMGWKCFVIEPADVCRRSLRRYSNISANSHSFHDVEAIIDPEIPKAEVEEVCRSGSGEFEGDPRWPKACICGYKFHPEDHWQVNVIRLYRGSSDGKMYTLRDRGLPIGAMWEASWLDHPNWNGPDGKAWCIRFPGGQDWIVYGPSSDGKKWTVSGDPPILTASPSIGIPGTYHGFLKNGVISEDVDGRKFEGIPRTA